MGVLEKIPTFLIVGVLVIIFVGLKRHARSARLTLWTVGWTLVFTHFLAQLLEPDRGPANSLLLAVDSGSLQAAVVTFLVSVSFGLSCCSCWACLPWCTWYAPVTTCTHAGLMSCAWQPASAERRASSSGYAARCRCTWKRQPSCARWPESGRFVPRSADPLKKGGSRFLLARLVGRVCLFAGT